MNKYEFTIIASGLDPSAADFENRLFEAGCDDSIVAFVKGRIVLEFEREARNFGHALVSAVRDVTRAGAKVARIEPDYLVSLTDIAERVGITRAAASLYSHGKRGQGFPAPVARVTTDTPLWDWLEVARWMYRRRTISLDKLVQAKMVREANRAVALADGNIDDTPFARKVSQMAA